jgi:hypothetical protein
MDGSISVGDVVVCRVNATSNLYVIGTVAAGNIGDLSLVGVTTKVGLTHAIAYGYRHRTPDESVWLFDGAASGYVKTVAPRSLLYEGPSPG